MESDLGSPRVENEPPSVSKDCRTTDIDTNDHVAEEKPRPNERLPAVTGWQAHNSMIGRIEAKRSRRQTIRDKVDPEKLDGNESFRHSEEYSQKDRHNLSDVRRDYAKRQKT